ncbi:MAG: DinB family protein [Spirochaetota bacterium]
MSIPFPEPALEATYEGRTAWAMALHCAFWKWLVGRRLSGGSDAFPYAPDDFPEVPAGATENDWMRDLAYLDEQHARLKEAVASLTDAQIAAPWIDQNGSEADGTVGRMVMGIAFHDAYHTAQIRNMGLPSLRHPSDRE